MDVTGVLEYLGWALMAVVKFVITPSMMIGAGYSPLESWIITAAGAVFGVWVFWNFGRLFFQWYDNRMQSLGRDSKTFTPGRRRLMRWKKSLGWTGLLVVSGLISVPVPLCWTKYFGDRPRAMFELMWRLFCGQEV